MRGGRWWVNTAASSFISWKDNFEMGSLQPLGASSVGMSPACPGGTHWLMLPQLIFPHLLPHIPTSSWWLLVSTQKKKTYLHPNCCFKGHFGGELKLRCLPFWMSSGWSFRRAYPPGPRLGPGKELPEPQEFSLLWPPSAPPAELT